MSLEGKIDTGWEHWCKPKKDEYCIFMIMSLYTELQKIKEKNKKIQKSYKYIEQLKEN